MRARASALNICGRQRQCGHALTVVSVMGVLVMGCLCMGFLRTHNAVRLEAWADRRLVRTTQLIPALAAGVALLRSGSPPSDPYECVVSPSGTAPVAPSVLYFSAGTDPDTWQVTARVASQVELQMLPPLPASF